MNLEMVSDRREHPLEASVKVLSRLDIRNPVKTSPVQKQAKLLKKCYVQTHRRMHRRTDRRTPGEDRANSALLRW